MVSGDRIINENLIHADIIPVNTNRNYNFTNGKWFTIGGNSIPNDDKLVPINDNPVPINDKAVPINDNAIPINVKVVPNGGIPVPKHVIEKPVLFLSDRNTRSFVPQDDTFKKDGARGRSPLLIATTKNVA